MKTTGLFALGTGLLMLASCSTTRTQSSPSSAAGRESDAEAELCRNMAEGQAAIREYPAVTRESLLSDVQDANEKVEEAVRDVRESAGDVNNTGLLTIQAAYEELQNTVNAVPGGRSTVGEASEKISADAGNLRSAWNRLYANLQCGA